MSKNRPGYSASEHDHLEDDDASDPRSTPHMPDAKVDIPRIERAVREILLAVGEDPDREGLLKSPNRVAGAYGDVMAGLRYDRKGRVKAVFHCQWVDAVVLG